MAARISSTTGERFGSFEGELGALPRELDLPLIARVEGRPGFWDEDLASLMTVLRIQTDMKQALPALMELAEGVLDRGSFEEGTNARTF